MLHLPKKGYWLFGSPKIEFVPNTSSLCWVREDFKGQLSLEDLGHLCFVHGSLVELLDEKKCVVRDRVSMVNSQGYWDHSNQKICFHLSGGEGVLLFIGYTQNGNSVVVFKKQ